MLAAGFCSTCEAVGPLGLGFTDQEAIENATVVWNTRTPSPEAEALAKAVEDHIHDCRQNHEKIPCPSYCETRLLCAALAAYRAAHPKHAEEDSCTS